MVRRRMLARAAALTAVNGAATALVGEGVLRMLPATRRPFSAPVRVSVEIEAPIEAVWEVVADIPAQVQWMPEMKRVTVLTPGPVREGTIGEATVRIFGIAVTDRVTITAFRPPVAFAIEHEGLFGGWGRLDMEPGVDGTTTIVKWEEALVPPWLPAFGWLAGRPIIRYLYQRDLFLLRNLVEDRRAARAAS